MIFDYNSKFPDELALDALLPPTVRWAAMRPVDANVGALFPLEYVQIAQAAPERQREYAAVRQLARALFPDFGLEPCAIPNGLDRAPHFPPEVIGSFSHIRELALAVLAPSRDFAAIGIDVESRLPLPYEIVDQVLDKSERAAIIGRPNWCDRLVFSAKEAAYKAQYHLSGQFLDFDALTIAFHPTAARFVAKLGVAAGPLQPGDLLEGRYHVTESLVVTVVTIKSII